SIAIACQRSTFSIFENLTICKSNTAFGYISLIDQKTGYNPTGLSDQCYVSDNFRNIRIYECCGYAFDLKKEFPQGDSGSAYDNIYISNSKWLGGASDQPSQGAIRGDNTIATFTQLNIEGNTYSSTLIELGGFSRLCIQSIHIEGLRPIPSIANIKIQSILKTGIVDIQRCTFNTEDYNMFMVKDNGVIDVDGLCIRSDCVNFTRKDKNLKEVTLKGRNSISIANIIDGAHILSK
ncbi:MAG: hypothetical protein K2H85_07345, partial [Allobaculum sp.]|nr:hypothetical protein [Allobaculum sp.]